MAATKGNKWWELRATHGRAKTFSSPLHLWESACEYFEWVEESPLFEAKLFKVKNSLNEDEIVSENVEKMRAMTIDSLCLYLDIGKSTWSDYRNRDGYEDFSAVIEKIESIIRSQKFEGAAADLLNANIIARDLGLKDSSETTHNGSIGFTDMTNEQLDARLEALINASAES